MRVPDIMDCGSAGAVAAASHAVAYALKLAKTMSPEQVILVNLSGRGDKDMHTVAQRSGLVL